MKSFSSLKVISMIKKCRYCGAEFEARPANKKQCDECRSKKRKVKQEKPKPISVLDMSRIIEAHNRKYGTHYTYGEFEKLLKQEKIFILDGESFEKR